MPFPWSPGAELRPLVLSAKCGIFVARIYLNPLVFGAPFSTMELSPESSDAASEIFTRGPAEEPRR